MSKFYETLKAIFHDVECFLNTSLKDVKLPKAVVAEKESILKKLADIEEEFPQLKSVGVTNTDQPALAKSSLPQKSTEQAELRKKANTPQVVDRSEVSSEIYSALDEDEHEQETTKASSSISDVSEAASFISVQEAMLNASRSGMLLKKNVSKSKVDIKSLLMSRGKKFCVVSGGVFYIFDKQTSKKQLSSFPLKGYEARVSSDQPSKKEFLFELVNPGQKSYAFASTAQDDMQQWISVLTAEAMKIPDTRTSLVYEANDSSDGEDYEEPDDNPSPAQPIKPAKSKPSPQLKSNVNKVAISSPPEDEDFYDDVQAPAAVDDEEIYDDAESKAIEDSDDLIYESFDDVNEVPAVKTDVRIAKAPSSPPPPVIARIDNAKYAKPSAVLSSPTVGRSVSSKLTTNADGSTDYENMFYSKWNCRADGDNELTFKHGDIILVLSREYDHFGWWVGKLNGKVGLVPREYLTPAYELVSDGSVQ